MHVPGPGIHLERDDDRVADVDLLAEAVGGRTGLGAVLEDLNRRARRLPVPGTAADWGVALDVEDSLTMRWWPQGITSSADGSEDETFAGRKVIVTSSYSKTVRGLNKGSRLTFFDVTDRTRVRYRHVLLVEAVVDAHGVTLRPVRIHAGGIVWHGPFLHVAGTSRGLFSFRVDDIVRLPAGSPGSLVGRLDDGRYAGYGYRYVLPVRHRYTAVTAQGHVGVRYSFVSLDRSGDPNQLLAGEYGRGDQTTRLVRFDLEPATGLIGTDLDGASRPRTVELAGVPQMQGAVSVHGRLYITQSHGRTTRGSIWVGRPGGLVPYRHALPPGPEDVSYWPSADELWSVSEHPLQRFVYTVDRARFD